MFSFGKKWGKGKGREEEEGNFWILVLGCFGFLGMIVSVKLSNITAVGGGVVLFGLDKYIFKM